MTPINSVYLAQSIARLGLRAQYGQDNFGIVVRVYNNDSHLPRCFHARSIPGMVALLTREYSV